MARKKCIRRITAARKVALNRLADILYEFLPLTAHSPSAVTFKTIFAESSLLQYFNQDAPKRQNLANVFTNVYRYHPKLPKALIRKIVPAAIDYRRHMRRPLTQAELTALSDCLFELGIDMRAELKDIILDETLPRMTVPPKKLEERLRNHDLDPKISLEPLQLFSDGHFNEAVRKGAEIFEDYVQAQSSLDTFGKDLMAKAFKDDTYIDLSGIQPENQAGFIEGYRFLAMGTMSAIRNVFSHGNEERRTPEECCEMLMFLNWLFRCVKESCSGGSEE